tara:strand:- start:22807 stop:23706 length:900 start_codon:yes stop_codon:yes gene_type:complete
MNNFKIYQLLKKNILYIIILLIISAVYIFYISNRNTEILKVTISINEKDLINYNFINIFSDMRMKTKKYDFIFTNSDYLESFTEYTTNKSLTTLIVHKYAKYLNRKLEDYQKKISKITNVKFDNIAIVIEDDFNYLNVIINVYTNNVEEMVNFLNEEVSKMEINIFENLKHDLNLNYSFYQNELENSSKLLELYNKIVDDDTILNKKAKEISTSINSNLLFDNSKKQIELIELENFFNKTKFKIDKIKNSIFKKIDNNYSIVTKKEYRIIDSIFYLILFSIFFPIFISYIVNLFYKNSK